MYRCRKMCRNISPGVLTRATTKLLWISSTELTFSRTKIKHASRRQSSRLGERPLRTFNAPLRKLPSGTSTYGRRLVVRGWSARAGLYVYSGRVLCSSHRAVAQTYAVCNVTPARTDWLACFRRDVFDTALTRRVYKGSRSVTHRHRRYHRW